MYSIFSDVGMTDPDSAFIIGGPGFCFVTTTSHFSGNRLPFLSLIFSYVWTGDVFHQFKIGLNYWFKLFSQSERFLNGLWTLCSD